MKLPTGKPVVANASNTFVTAADRPAAAKVGPNIVGQQVWRIIGYNHAKQISDEKVLWKSADVAAIVALLRERVSRHLSTRDLEAAHSGGSTHLEPRYDADTHRRLTISMGVDLVYVATLWRSDDAVAG